MKHLIRPVTTYFVYIDENLTYEDVFDYLELWKLIGVPLYILNILLKVVNNLNLCWILFCDKWGREDIREKMK